MPAYNTFVPPPAIYPGDKQTLWNAEASTGITTSQQVYITSDVGTGNTECLVELSFSGAPGVFEVDVQFSGTDADTSYITASLGGAITSVNANNKASYKFSPTLGPFMRFSKSSITNSVNVTATVTR